ncbi:MAG: hypothetical protein Q8R00_03620 [Candidatus Nanoarchaeia archaeon]|nr:hypothetical protein [Candidatus Nanoarchaeia archaeon]
MVDSQTILKDYLSEARLSIAIHLHERTKGAYQYPDLQIDIARSCVDLSWDYLKRKLPEEEAFMLPLNIWVDFANLLFSDKPMYNCARKKIPKKVVEAIRSDIFEVRGHYRGEWIDAKFEEGTITYPKFDSSGKLTQVTEPLEGCLMEDRLPGINLESWLKNPTSQGFPKNKIKKGDLYYGCPRVGTVALFGAYSVWAGLGCFRYPQYSGSDLGVRRAKIFEGRK